MVEFAVTMRDEVAASRGGNIERRGNPVVTTPAREIAQRYVRLALAVGQHFPWYVDAYFGPPEWADRASREGARPVDILMREASDLIAVLAGDGGAAMDAQRCDFLARQALAMQTTLRTLHGEQLPIAEEVNALFDLSPKWIDEAVFEEAHRALDALLPAGESLSQHMAIRREATEVGFELARPLLREISAELRRRTQTRYPLPLGESLELQLVSGQPYYANNCYLGDFRSRLDLNTDIPLHITELVYLMAHEGYPGHHTEFSIKDSRLARGQNRIEHCISLINTPSCVVSEGIATRALSTLMTDEEQVAWHEEELFPRAGFTHLDAHHEHAIGTIMAPHGELAGAHSNAIFLMHDRGVGEGEVAAYLQRYGLLSPEEARKEVEFIADPFFRSYLFTYRCGGELLDGLFAAQDDLDHWFARLLTEPITPGQIRSMSRPTT